MHAMSRHQRPAPAQVQQTTLFDLSTVSGRTPSGRSTRFLRTLVPPALRGAFLRTLGTFTRSRSGTETVTAVAERLRAPDFAEDVPASRRSDVLRLRSAIEHNHRAAVELVNAVAHLTDDEVERLIERMRDDELFDLDADVEADYGRICD
jgi:hypothetical protein